MSAHCVKLAFPPELLEAIARRAVEILAEKTPNGSTPYLTVDEAAAYLKCSKQAVYDRVHEGRLKPRRDGRRLLFHREQDLDAYLAGGAS